MAAALTDDTLGVSRAWLTLVAQPAALFSLSGRVLNFNQPFAQTVFALFQIVPRSGLPWQKLVAGRPVVKSLREFLKTPKPSEGSEREIVIGVEGESSRRFRMKWQPLFSENGHRQAMAFSALDVTEELAVEREVVTGESRFSSSLFFQLEGPDAKVQPRWENCIHPDDRTETLKAVRVPNGKPWTYRLKTKSGGWRWFSARAFTSEWSEGVPAKVSILHQDVTRTKRLEQTTAEAEARWESVVNGAPVGIALISRTGKILFNNGRLETFLPSNSVGHSVKETLSEVLWSEFDRALQTCFSTGQSGVLTSSFHHLDEGVLTLEHFLGPLKGPDGVQSVVLFSFDTTEKARWERHTSRESLVQEFILELHSQTGDSADGLLERALQAALELTSSGFGFVVAEDSAGKPRIVAGIPFLPESSSEISRVDLGPWTEALTDEKPFLDNGILDVPVSWGLPGKTVRRCLGVPIFRGGRGVGLVVVGQRDDPFTDDDIMELRSLVEGAWQVMERRKIEQSNRLLFQALEFIPASVVITDPQGTIEYVNQHFSTLMGYEKTEAVGSPIAIVDSGLIPSVTSENLLSSIRKNLPWRGDLINKKKNGQLLWESVSVAPVFDIGGKPTHFVSVQEDITEKRQSQEALLQARKMESVGQLAAGVAHDFNNLLASLLAMNDMLLLKLPEGDPLRKFPEKIGKAGRRAADLVCSLLAFGRRQRLRQEVVDLRELLREEAGLLESMLRGEVLLRTFLEGPPLLVDVDAGQISQVVMNLVSNARDAMEESGGTVTIEAGSTLAPETSTTKNWAFFSIQDNGPGIPVEVQERIFEPFFTTKEIGKGTGLGLSVVSGIVEQHHGKVVLESSPGQGALFTVYLPIAPVEPPVLEPAE